MFYEIKLKVEKENSKGEMKEVVEHFITDVELFAEAEAKGLEQYNGDCDVFSITRSKVIEIVNEKEEGKPFYKATLIDIFIDDNGNEKETKYYNLVCAKDITEANRPKVLFAEAVETSQRSCLIGELAKILNQNGIKIGQNRLFQLLRDEGYLCKTGENYNLPTQRAMEMNLFEIKKTIINKPDGTILVTTTTKVTGKGQIYFINKFLREKQQKQAV